MVAQLKKMASKQGKVGLSERELYYLPFKAEVDDLSHPIMLFASHQYTPSSIMLTESKINID